MKGKLRFREGLPEEDREVVNASVQALDPYNWVKREDAAAHLAVGIRTIDRYIRRGQLTSYSGMLPTGGYGVRLWQPDVAQHRVVQPTVVEG